MRIKITKRNKEKPNSAKQQEKKNTKDQEQ